MELGMSPVGDSCFMQAQTRRSRSAAQMQRVSYSSIRARRFSIERDTIAQTWWWPCAGRRAGTTTTATSPVGQFSVRSDKFRIRWASHDVRFHRSGTKRFHHPLVGDLTLAYQLMAAVAMMLGALVLIGPLRREELERVAWRSRVSSSLSSTRLGFLFIGG
ncbi:MAG: hypothetical protein ACRDG7_01545 [Candidatus Limnocylindria bacterium]